MRSIREPDTPVVRVTCQDSQCRKFPRQQTFLTQFARDRFGSVVSMPLGLLSLPSGLTDLWLQRLEAQATAR